MTHNTDARKTAPVTLHKIDEARCEDAGKGSQCVERTDSSTAAPVAPSLALWSSEFSTHNAVCSIAVRMLRLEKKQGLLETSTRLPD